MNNAVAFWDVRSISVPACSFDNPSINQTGATMARQSLSSKNLCLPFHATLRARRDALVFMHSMTCVMEQADSSHKLPSRAHINDRDSFKIVVSPEAMHMALNVSEKKSRSPRTLVSLGYASRPAED